MKKETWFAPPGYWRYHRKVWERFQPIVIGDRKPAKKYKRRGYRCAGIFNALFRRQRERILNRMPF